MDKLKDVIEGIHKFKMKEIIGENYLILKKKQKAFIKNIIEKNIVVSIYDLEEIEN
jgi:hypothetical protein